MTQIKSDDGRSEFGITEAVQLVQANPARRFAVWGELKKTNYGIAVVKSKIHGETIDYVFKKKSKWVLGHAFYEPEIHHFTQPRWRVFESEEDLG